ncbi:MAG: hypothetical protein FJZ79_02620 [Chlorobi bacterium]|nr:hypothetical protein [Chlorobiota bacterium]
MNENNSNLQSLTENASVILFDLERINGRAFNVSAGQLEAFRMQAGLAAPRADACTLCDVPNDTCNSCDASDWLNPPTPCVTCDEGDQVCTYCDAPKDSCDNCDAMDGDCGTGKDACMTCDEGDADCAPVDIR